MAWNLPRCIVCGDIEAEARVILNEKPLVLCSACWLAYQGHDALQVMLAMIGPKMSSMEAWSEQSKGLSEAEIKALGEKLGIRITEDEEIAALKRVIEQRRREMGI